MIQVILINDAVKSPDVKIFLACAKGPTRKSVLWREGGGRGRGGREGGGGEGGGGGERGMGRKEGKKEEGEDRMEGRGREC